LAEYTALSCECYGHNGLAWAYPDDLVYAAGRLINSSIKGVAGATIKVYYHTCDSTNGANCSAETLITVTTDASGNWYIPTKKLSAYGGVIGRRVDFRADYAGNSTYAASNDKCYIRVYDPNPVVTKVATKIVCTLDAATINVNTANVLRGQLLTNDGSNLPIPSSIVGISLGTPLTENEYSLGSVTTDSSGKFVVTIPATYNTEPSTALVKYIVHAQFFGDSNYIDSYCEKLYDVTGCTYPSGVAPSQCYSSSYCTLGETLCDSNNKLECKKRTDCIPCYVKTGTCYASGPTNISCTCYGNGGLAWAYPSDLINARGKLMDGQLNGISGQPVKVYYKAYKANGSISAETAVSMVTDINGYFATPQKTAAQLGGEIGGKIAFRPVFEGNGTLQGSSNGPCYINIFDPNPPPPPQIPTKMSCVFDFASIAIGTSNVLRGQLITNDGLNTGVPTKVIHVSLLAPSYENELVVESVVTDAYGYFTVIIPSSWHTEPSTTYVKYGVHCEFAGDNDYLTSNCQKTYDVTGCVNPNGVDAGLCVGNSTCTLKENYCEGGRQYNCVERKDCQRCYVDAGLCGVCTPNAVRPAISCPGEGGIETCKVVNGANAWVLTTPCPIIKFTSLSCILSKSGVLPGDVQSVSGYLRTQDGIAIANATILITVIDPSNVAVDHTTYTGADGAFTLSFAPASIYGQWTVSTYFDGTTGATSYLASSCNKTFQVQCVNGELLDAQTCPDGTVIYGQECQNGAFVLTNEHCATCAEGQSYDPFTCQNGNQIYLKKCVGGELVNSNESCLDPACVEGQKYDMESCSDGSVIYHKKCLNGVRVDTGEVCPTCQAGTTKCQNDVPYQCQNGQWVEGGNACDECTAGQTKCEGNVSYQCQNGQWAQGGNACQGSQCNQGQTKCQNGYYWYCENGYWKMGTTPCDDGGGGGIFGNLDIKSIAILGGAGIAAILGIALITRRP
jgi:hypothetical protein